MDHYNSRFAKLLAPRGALRWAVTIGKRTWYSVPKERVSDAWRRHENRHKAQWAEAGAAKFLWRYTRDYLRGRKMGMSHMAAYYQIGYEIDARRAERANTPDPV